MDGIDEQGGRAVLARAITQLARALDLEVIAEGIEEPGQVAVLRRLGCGRGQGYLFARPLPESEICPLLEAGLIPRWIDARPQLARDAEEAPERGAA